MHIVHSNSRLSIDFMWIMIPICSSENHIYQSLSGTPPCPMSVFLQITNPNPTAKWQFKNNEGVVCHMWIIGFLQDFLPHKQLYIPRKGFEMKYKWSPTVFFLSGGWFVIGHFLLHCFQDLLVLTAKTKRVHILFRFPVWTVVTFFAENVLFCHCSLLFLK